jgi:ubiquinone biosynthesis protein Coq4
MPVPFPSAEATKQTPPDAAEARIIAGGVAAAVAPGGALTSLQRLLIESVTDSMTGFVVPASTVPRLDSEALARALADRNEGFRERMVHFMLLCTLVLNPLPEEVVARVQSYAHELGVNDSMIRIAQEYAHGSMGLALVDFQRSGYMETWDPAQSAALHTSTALSEAWEQCALDASLAQRWEALRDLPEGTLGRGVVDFYDARGFEFPGRPGSAPPLLAQHDWMHVLAHYGSTVEAELEVFAFISRANDDPRGFSLLAMVISLFETGYLASGAGLFQYDRGHLSHEGMAVRLADALRRGALVGAHAGGPDLLRIDWFERADRPIDDVRAEMGVAPKSDAALAAGSVGPWETGGISPFQYAEGRRRAEAAGREYDPHGATPA